VTTDEKIKAAFDKLLQGRPELTDGQLTATNVCLEAGVSRASFYRSSHAASIRQALTNPGSVPSPETEQLREQVRELKQADQTLRRQHATEIRELRATARTYANQIQVLTLRITQLEDDNQRLERRLHDTDDNVTTLATRR
jgi:DNA repair exonuclease SbcCD ATPase subunit